MEFFDLVKKNIAFAVDANSGGFITFNKIGGGSVTISKDSKGIISIDCNPVEIVGTSLDVHNHFGVSSSKKIAGGLVGGALAGPIGAIVGTMGIGNNKKISTKTITIEYRYIDPIKKTYLYSDIKSAVLEYEREKYNKLTKILK